MSWSKIGAGRICYLVLKVGVRRAMDWADMRWLAGWRLVSLEDQLGHDVLYMEKQINPTVSYFHLVLHNSKAERCVYLLCFHLVLCEGVIDGSLSLKKENTNSSTPKTRPKIPPRNGIAKK